jgi:hypothetical protein
MFAPQTTCATLRAFDPIPDHSRVTGKPEVNPQRWQTGTLWVSWGSRTEKLQNRLLGPTNFPSSAHGRRIDLPELACWHPPPIRDVQTVTVGRHAGEPAEGTGEMALIAESAVQSNP